IAGVSLEDAGVVDVGTLAPTAVDTVFAGGGLSGLPSGMDYQAGVAAALLDGHSWTFTKTVAVDSPATTFGLPIAHIPGLANLPYTTVQFADGPDGRFAPPVLASPTAGVLTLAAGPDILAPPFNAIDVGVGFTIDFAEPAGTPGYYVAQIDQSPLGKYDYTM